MAKHKVAWWWVAWTNKCKCPKACIHQSSYTISHSWAGLKLWESWWATSECNTQTAPLNSENGPSTKRQCQVVPCLWWNSQMGRKWDRLSQWRSISEKLMVFIHKTQCLHGKMMLGSKTTMKLFLEDWMALSLVSWWEKMRKPSMQERKKPTKLFFQTLCQRLKLNSAATRVCGSSVTKFIQLISLSEPSGPSGLEILIFMINPNLTNGPWNAQNLPPTDKDSARLTKNISCPDHQSQCDELYI